MREREAEIEMSVCVVVGVSEREREREGGGWGGWLGRLSSSKIKRVISLISCGYLSAGLRQQSVAIPP